MTSRESERRGGIPIDETLRPKNNPLVKVKVCHRMEYDKVRRSADPNSRLRTRAGRLVTYGGGSRRGGRKDDKEQRR